MRAPAKFHDFLKRLFGRPTDQETMAAPIDAQLEPAREVDPAPLFSLGEAKQELVASYRKLEGEGV